MLGYTTKDTLNWLDAWEMTTEIIAEHWSNPQHMIAVTGMKGELPPFDVKRYRVFRESVIKVKKLIIDYGLNLGDELSVEGVEINPKTGDVMPTGPVKLYPSETAIVPIEFRDMDAGVIAHLLTWYLAASKQGTDPQAYTRRVLAHQGVKSWGDFEANKDKFLIQNPFPPPEDGIITPE